MQNHKWLSVPWERMEYYTACIGNRIENKLVIDLGCSAGAETLFLALRYAPKRIIGVDNFGSEGGSPECRAIFAQNVQAAGCRIVSIVQADAFSLPFEPGSVDVLICSQTLHHLFISDLDLRSVNEKRCNDMVTKLREWHTVLKPDGELLIRETSRYHFLRLLASIGLTSFSGRVNFKTKQEPAVWCWLLERAGFFIEEVAYYVPYTLRSFKPLVQKHWVNLWVNHFYLIRAIPRK